MNDDEYANFLKTELKIDDDTLVESLTKNREEVEKLAKEMNANSEATKALNKQIAANALSNNKAVQQSKYQDEILATTGKLIDKDKEKALQDLEDEGWGTKGINFLSGKNSKEAQKILEEYAQAAGLGDIELTDVKGRDKKRADNIHPYSVAF